MSSFLPELLQSSRFLILTMVMVLGQVGPLHGLKHPHNQYQPQSTAEALKLPLPSFYCFTKNSTFEVLRQRLEMSNLSGLPTLELTC